MDWTSLLELTETATLALCLLCMLALWQTTKGE